jgi:hypothetical protein
VLPPGDYSVQFDGDFKSTLEFTIANFTLPFREDVYTLSYTEQEYATVATLFLIQLIITIPFPIGQALWQRYLDWLSEGSSGGWQYWVFSIFLGFLAVRMRIETLPKLMRWSLLVFTIAPLCIPVVITSVEGHIGGVWLFGHICGGKLNYYIFTPLFVALYQIVVLMPMIVIYAAIAAERHRVQFVDVAFAVFSLGGLIALDMKYPAESAGPARALGAPLVSLAPMWLWGLAAYEIWRKWPRSESKKADTDSGLLDDENTAPPPPAQAQDQEEGLV